MIMIESNLIYNNDNFLQWAPAYTVWAEKCGRLEVQMLSCPVSTSDAQHPRSLGDAITPLLLMTPGE